MLTPLRWQMMIQQQDSTLNSITGTLATLAQQAGLMGQEISEHTECVLQCFREAALVELIDVCLQNAGRLGGECGSHRRQAEYRNEEAEEVHT